jgi:hypothetical protein
MPHTCISSYGRRITAHSTMKRLGLAMKMSFSRFSKSFMNVSYHSEHVIAAGAYCNTPLINNYTDEIIKAVKKMKKADVDMYQFVR